MSMADGQQLPDETAHPASQPQAAPKSTEKRVSISPDRRRHQRVKLEIQGRFMRADKQDYPCTIQNISPGGLAMTAAVSCEIGEHVILYLPDLGRFEGEVVRLFPDGFAVRLTGTAYKREKIANQLTWILNRSKLDLTEDRAHERIVPSKQHIKLAMSDGTEREGRILDVSLGGASVSVLPKPNIGDQVTIGLIRGTVVRHHDQGIGIRFLEIQDPSTIERQFG